MSRVERLNNWRRAENLPSSTKLVTESSWHVKIGIYISLLSTILWEYVKLTPEIFWELYQLIVGKQLKNIEGKVVLVTGAGNGLGRMISLFLAREGTIVICVDIDEKAAEQTAKEINLQYGENRAKAYGTDLSLIDEVQNLKNNVSSDFGTIDILVNNAGVIPLLGLFEGSEEDIKRIIDINLMSQFWMARAFVPDMQNKGDGHVVSISSICSIYYGCYPKMTAYVTSKCAVSGLTACIKADAPNVKTTIIMPMTIATRKSIVDHVHCTIPPLTPEEVAHVTIDAIQREYEIVTIPKGINIAVSFFGMLPSVFRKPFEKVISPNIS